MLRSDISYPYPVLRTTATDFNKGVFKSGINVEVDPKSKVFKFVTDFSVTNATIKNMLENGLAKYVLFVFCKDTFFRHVYKITSDKNTIEISGGDVKGKVEYISYIVADRDITNYSSDDFSLGYKGISFIVKRGEILGIGESGGFSAVYENEATSDISSIVSFQNGKDNKFMQFNYEKDIIEIYLPEEQYLFYKKTDKYNKDCIHLLNSFLVIPALSDAIKLMYDLKYNSDDDIENKSYYSSKDWYKCLEEKILALSDELNKSYETLLEDHTVTAQRLVNNLFSIKKAFKIFEQMEE